MEEEQIDKVKLSRKLLRSTVTKISNELQRKDLSHDTVRIKVSLIEQLETELSSKDEIVMDNLLFSGDESACEQEYEHVMHYRELIERVKLFKMQDLGIADGYISEASSVGGMNSGNGNCNVNINLPKLELESFDVQPNNYLNFWAQFKPIHEATHLTNDMKFQYLRMTVKGSSKNLVDSYPISSNNYTKVIEHLKERFGKDELIVQSLYRDLLGLVRARPNIIVLADAVQCKIRSLESLGITKDKSDILVPLIEECLTEDIQERWQRQDIDSKANKLDAILTFISKEASATHRVKEITSVVPATAAALVSTKAKERVSTSGQSGMKCIFCSNNHLSKDCRKPMTVEARRELVRKSKVCYACLRYGHPMAKCRTRVDCTKCTGRHYDIVCPGSSKDSKYNAKSSTETVRTEISMLAGQEVGDDVVLQTLLVKVGGCTARAIIDSGSQRSYIASSLCNRMSFNKVGEEKFCHMLFGSSVSEIVNHDLVDVTLCSLYGKGMFSFKALCLDRICGQVESKVSEKVALDLRKEGILLTDTKGDLPIEILLGADVMASLIVSVRSVGKVLAFETRLGWCLVGSVSKGASSLLNMSMSLLNVLPNMWDLEPLGIEKAKSISVQEEECLKQFKNTIKFSGDRYHVSLPWREGHPPLPSERDLAESRLRQVVYRLERNGLYGKYDEVFQQWESEGIIEFVKNDDYEGHYLPHRPVIKEGKSTSLRPVFDASAKSRRGGAVSLNECLHTGPNLVNELFRVLLSFRQNSVGITADIRQAFLMIGLSKDSDKNQLKFLWIREGKIIVYRHCRVVFGLSPSPFLLQATLGHHLSKFGEAGRDLLNSLYVDDCVRSEKNRDSAELFKQTAVHMLAPTFELRRWVMTGDNCGPTKVLGIKWVPETDAIACCKPRAIEGNEITKRSLLTMIGRVYDPLGIISAAMLPLKVVLQECFKQKLEWDTALPREVHLKVERWLTFKKNVRVMGWISRFINNARSGKENSNELTVSEIAAAELKLFKYIQARWPPDAGELLTEIDKNGLIRVRSKILSETFSEEFKTPILLGGCDLIKALIKEEHEKMHHVGVNWILNYFRNKFWIVKGRQLVKGVIRRCVPCQKFRKKPMVTPPIGLPNYRVELGKVFQVCGCDLFGPLFLRDQSKVWVVIFTCAVYRAVHFEIVDTCSSESFCRALRRMISRRGKISVMISDNGTNMKGLWNSIRVEAVADLSVVWRFNVPTASWWGGFFERLIGVIKMCLKTSLGRALLTAEELYTVVVEIEAVMNNRPLTYVTMDLDEPAAITPSNFLQQEETSVNMPELDAVDRNSLIQRVRYVATVREDLKIRFKSEYLGALFLRNQKISNDEIKVGSVVYITSDNKKRIDWDLGRVMELMPGKDQVCRVVRLKTGKGEVLRPVQRLCVLEGLTPTPELTDVRSYDDGILDRPDVRAIYDSHSDVMNADIVDDSNSDLGNDGDEPAYGSGQTTNSQTRTGRVVRKPDRLDL